MRRLLSYNPNAGGGGPPADGTVTSAKLGGDVTAAGKSILTAANKAAQRAWLDMAVADVAGLQTALDGKQAAGSYAASTHTHAISDTTGLQTALDGKAASSHTHAGMATVSKAFLSSTLPNSTVTPAVLTGATFTLTPGQTGTFTAVLVCTSAATTTGVGAGFRVAQAAGADGNARGAWFATALLASTAAATGLQDGDVFNVAANANSYGELLGTATTSGNNALQVTAVVTNSSTNANTTVTFEFRSEVASSAVTAQIGSGVTAIIG